MQPFASAFVVNGDRQPTAVAAIPSARDGGRDEPATPRLTLPWLIRLRWAAVAAQALLLTLGAWYGWLPAPLPLTALVGAACASNAALQWAQRRPVLAASKVLLGSVLLADVLLLTGMLMVSGGPSNPFTIAYLVHVTLAAVTLGEPWAWLVVVIAVSGYATLFVWHVPLAAQAHQPSGLPSHLVGMWVAFAASAALIAFFATRVTRTLVRRERELADLRQVAARHERLASLTTLAAGAAHELATPLASIAVAARELERTAREHAASAYLDDAHLIRSQVERCRVILDSMSGRASQEWVERPTPVEVSDILALVRETLGERATHLHVTGSMTASLLTSKTGLAQALLNLIRNAFDASPPGANVELAVETRADRIAFIVVDAGSGIATQILPRLGEPFYTTKPTGSGYGLGLFLVRLFADHHRGRLEIQSAPGSGTRVSLELPCEAS